MTRWAGWLSGIESSTERRDRESSEREEQEEEKLRFGSRFLIGERSNGWISNDGNGLDIWGERRGRFVEFYGCFWYLIGRLRNEIDYSVFQRCSAEALSIKCFVLDFESIIIFSFFLFFYFFYFFFFCKFDNK